MNRTLGSTNQIKANMSATHSRRSYRCQSVEALGWSLFFPMLNIQNMNFISNDTKKIVQVGHLFNFGRAPGTEHLAIDVLGTAISYSTVLQRKFANNRETFQEEFLRLAEEAECHSIWLKFSSTLSSSPALGNLAPWTKELIIFLQNPLLIGMNTSCFRH